MADLDQLELDSFSYNTEAFMYCLCFRFNCAINSQPSESIKTKSDLQRAIRAGNIYISQRSFCVMFSTNAFFNLQGWFLMKIF